MKQKVQLFINNEEVDVFEDGSINIVSSIKDLRDPSKLFADYSRNFNLPATSRNNKVFKHYYNYDIVDGFDARKSVQAIIEVNNRPYKLGYINLEGVDLKNNKPSVYRVTFYGNLRFLKETFNEVKLSKLSWLNNFTFTYQAHDSSGSDSVFHYLTSSKNITDAEGVTHIQPIAVPLISNKQRLYYNSSDNYYGELEDGNLYYDGDYASHTTRNGVDWSGLAPSIRVDLIIKAIEKYVNSLPEEVNPYTIQFSTDFFNSANIDYYNLYMWLNKDVSDETLKTVNTPINTFPVSTAGSYLYSSGTPIPLLNVSFFSKDGQTSGNFANQIAISNIESDYADSVIVKLRLLSNDTSTTFTLQVNLDGEKFTSFGNQTQTGISGSPLEFETELDGVYEFILITDESSPIAFSGFELEIIPRVEQEYTYNIQTVNKTASGVTTYGSKQFFPTERLPDMTILEFLTGLFKMFNLVAEVKDTSALTKTIQVKTLDGFYNSSNTSLDITNKVDISSSKVDRPLNYTRIKFEYKDTDAILAKQHKEEIASDGWGAELWEISNAKGGETYEIIPPFGHMKFERLIDEETSNTTDIQVGQSITRGNRDSSDYTEQKYNPYFGDPVLFYPILQSNSEQIPYIYRNPNDLTTFSYINTIDYFIPSNSTGLSVSQTNHFGLELNEYLGSDAGSDYTDNLFNTYWKNYISSIFSKKNRFVKLKANLTNAFIAKYSLADKIVVSGRDYSINKININLINGKSDLELIPYYAVKSFYCLASLFTVKIQSTPSGYLYVFDNKYGVYQVGNGSYVFQNISSSHPIAFHNFGKENTITYTGTNTGGTKVGLDGNTYTYYSGDVTVNVTGDFGIISYECFHHGYMGGEDNLQYNSDCVAEQSPTPVEGTLTVDSIEYTSDTEFITADQTDE